MTKNRRTVNSVYKARYRGRNHFFRRIVNSVYKARYRGRNHFFAEQNIVGENRANVLLTAFVVRRQFLYEHIRHWELFLT